jgi:hydrogenase small subunit
MITRREFLRMAAALAAAYGIEGLPGPVAAALKKIGPETALPRLIYLQGLACTGCSISLLQADSPSVLSLITEYSQIGFHSDLSAVSGQKALDLINAFLDGKAGEYYLALEGAIPEKMPEACVIGDKPLADYLERAAGTMSGAVAVGACACDGGIPGAEGNVTGAIGLKQFLGSRSKDKPVIDIRGCPVHPDWVWHTIIHLVKSGLPKLVNDSPALFFSRKVHEQCPRYHDFQEEIFAKKLSDKGCLFKLGCLGPDTPADCPTRWWNAGRTWCINNNAPCIGCASPNFARAKSIPFYRISEKREDRNPQGDDE